MTKSVKAIGLLSGGLDSVLAARLLQTQGIGVIAVHFNIGFSSKYMKHVLGVPPSDEDLKHDQTIEELKDAGIDVREIDIREAFLKMLLEPAHGYGANMNPCIDCKILMLRKAAELMRQECADFVFTGEVLGQRPMSQRRHALDQIERASGLEGVLLRPLSAKYLKTTIPEKEGLVDREQLVAFKGRGRRAQLDLAKKLGVKHHGTPAGGCLLTEEKFANRLLDLIQHTTDGKPDLDDICLLSIGRHLRITKRAKVIVGRFEAENHILENYKHRGLLVEVVDVPGPITMVQGDTDGLEMLLAASITGRYSDAKNNSVVSVAKLGDNSYHQPIEVIPAPDTYTKAIMI